MTKQIAFAFSFLFLALPKAHAVSIHPRGEEKMGTIEIKGPPVPEGGIAEPFALKLTGFPPTWNSKGNRRAPGTGCAEILWDDKPSNGVVETVTVKAGETTQVGYALISINPTFEPQPPIPPSQFGIDPKKITTTVVTRWIQNDGKGHTLIPEMLEEGVYRPFLGTGKLRIEMTGQKPKEWEVKPGDVLSIPLTVPPQPNPSLGALKIIFPKAELPTLRGFDSIVLKAQKGLVKQGSHGAYGVLGRKGCTKKHTVPLQSDQPITLEAYDACLSKDDVSYFYEVGKVFFEERRQETLGGVFSIREKQTTELKLERIDVFPPEVTDETGKTWTAKGGLFSLYRQNRDGKWDVACTEGTFAEDEFPVGYGMYVTPGMYRVDVDYETQLGRQTKQYTLDLRGNS